MSGWFRQPVLSASLLLLWLLLVNSVGPGQILLGLILALVLPRITEAFWPVRRRCARAAAVLRFAGTVLGDIVVANLVVAKLILGRSEVLRPAFVEVPLDLRDELAIAVFASTISLTPGTVSSSLSADRRTLLVHALDVADEGALVAELKRRYEAPIREIFECSK